MALKRYIATYDNVLPLETVSLLTKFCSNLNYKKALVGGGFEKEHIRKVWNYSLNNSVSNMTEIKWHNFLKHIFINSVQKYIFDTVHQGAHDISPGRIAEIDVLKYDKGGHYVYHTDFFHLHPRQFSLILLLNNDYKGGELVFNNPKYDEEYKIETRPGRLIVWPSNFLFPHKVNEVEDGKRYSIVGWSH